MTDKNIRSLLDISIDIHDTLYPNNGKLFGTCINKFTQTYNKVDNTELFTDVFLKFFKNNSSDISKIISTDTIDKVSLTKKVKKEDKKSGWSVPKLEGYVIYLSEEDEKLKNVCIPITEIYQASLRLHMSDKDDIKYASYPPKILYHLYSIFLAILPSSIKEYKNIESNIKILSDIVEEVGSNVDDKVEPKSTGNMKDITKALKEVMRKSGVNLPGDAKQLDEAMERLVGEDSLNKIGKIVGEIGIDNKNEDLGSALSKIGTALQSESVKKTISEISEKTNKQTNDLISSIPGSQE